MVRSSIVRAVVLALGVTALGALPAMAQDTPAAPPSGQMRGGGGRGMEGHQLDFLTKKLNLTPDQVTQVKAIDEDTLKQAKALREDTSIAGPDRRAKMMDIHKASEEKIRALLTDDQKTRYDALQAEMRERMQNRNGAGGPPPPPPPQL
ncbi:MAG: hypothetical protein WDN23_10150 [Edaphobacter sp.]